MKVNVDFYDKKYDNTLNREINIYEKQILDIIEKSDSVYYDAVFNDETYSKTINNLSSINCNCIKWYNFESESSVLDISNNYGITSNFLVNKVKDVTCVIPSKIITEKLSKFFMDKDNIEIINADLRNIKFEKKYDYIIFADDLKDYLKYYDNSIAEFFKYLISLLTEKGKLLFITDNCFGIKYVSGASYKNNEKSLYSKDNEFELPSRNELKVALEKAGLTNYTFYYPLPDFNITNLIFSDKYLPKPNMSKLMYNLNYTEGSKIILNELETLKKITRKNEFTHFANSFFIEISKDEKYENKTKFVSFNNLRKEEYRLMTKMYDKYVEKTSYRKSSESHMKNIGKNIEKLQNLGFNLLDKYDEKTNIVTSKYVSEDSINLLILKAFNSNKIFDAINMIKDWYKYIYSLLEKDNLEDVSSTIFNIANVDIEQEKIQKLHFIKNGFIDLVFENTFFIDEKYYIYDQEWNYKNSPIEFILYRAINNLYSYDFNLENIISKQDMFKQFNIDFCINEFEKLEKYIQQDILDDERLKYYSRAYNYKLDLDNAFNEVESITDELKSVVELKDKLFIQKQGYEKDIEELNNKLNSIYNSKSWKFIEKIKKIRGKI